MSQAERFYEIDRILKTHRVVPLSRFMEELRVSRATIIRDLTYLKDRLRAPIVWDRDLRGYRLDGPSTLPAIYLNSAEIHALLVLHQLVTRIQPSFLDEQVRPLRDLIRKLIAKGDSGADEVGQRIRVRPMASRPVSAEHFQTVCRALMARQRVHLRYYARGRDQESERAVSPQRLVHYRDNWYLDAWCHARQGLRSFALDAIREAAPIAEPAIDIEEAQLDRELGSGYGIFAGADVRIAVLRFTPEMARWVSREQWHDAQEGSFEADGSYVLKIPYAAERELLMDILRYGPSVEVLAPEELRQSVAKALAETLSRYTGERQQ